MFRARSTLLAGALVFAVAWVAFALLASIPRAVNADEIPERVIVSLATTADPSDASVDAVEMDEIASAQDAVVDDLSDDAEVTRRFAAAPVLALEVGAGDRAALEADPRVTAVVDDVAVSASLLEGRALIGATLTFATGFTGSGITVAVVDTGIDTTHPAFAGRLAGDGRCFLSTTGCAGSATGTGLASVQTAVATHGTAVSGIIASNGNGAPLGVAPGATIFPYRVLGDSGVGFLSDTLAALDDIFANRPEVDVVNMSLGTSDRSATSCESLSSSFATTISALPARGTLVVVAAGNNGDTAGLSFPACLTDATAVGAVYDADIGARSYSVCSDADTKPDEVTCYSNSTAALDTHGEPLLDLVAPADCAATARAGGGALTCCTGTSSAAPYTSGSLAVLMAASPGQTAAWYESRLETTGRLVTDDSNSVTTPRIDIGAAVRSVTLAGAFHVAAVAGCNDVGGPVYCTIGAALAAATAGDVIEVAAGSYAERLTIGKNVTIFGRGADQTILDGGAGGSVITVANGITATLAMLGVTNGLATAGGGIANDGTLTLTDVAVTGNQVTVGGSSRTAASSATCRRRRDS